MQTEHGMSDESDVPLSAYISKISNKDTESTKEELVEEESTTNEKNPEPEQPASDQEMKNSPPAPKPAHHKVHVCHVCEAAFARANHLTRHMTLHRALLIHKCDRCDKAYATLEHLAKHVEEDHINKPYACTICNKPFSRGEHLIRHLKVHQSGNEKEDNLTCSICEKTFSRLNVVSWGWQACHCCSFQVGSSGSTHQNTFAPRQTTCLSRVWQSV
jgi:uncharacterized Zn-finger protein